MSGLTLTDGGLLVPKGSLEAAVLRALREHDDDLRLVPQGVDPDGRTYYKVGRYYGSERPLEWLLTWGDAKQAYPLSFQLVDEVKRHDRGTRGFDAKDSDTLNRERALELEKESRRQSEALLDDHRARIAGRTQVSMHVPRKRTRRP